jgi:hypothetical protein
MLHLTLAYIQQADRERKTATDLQNRQLLRSTPQTGAPSEPPTPTDISRRAPVRARAATR